VKTIVARCEGDDAVRRLGAHKADVVRRYAAHLDPPAGRVDFVAVTLRPGGADVRWSPFAC
jgi:hypothetical protein